MRSFGKGARRNLCLGLLTVLAAVATAAPGVARSGGGATPSATVADAGARLQSRDPDGAIEILAAITANEPDNAQAWLLLGVAWHTKGNLRKALPAHLKAARFDSTAPRGMFNAACAYALLGEADAAFSWLDRLQKTGRFDMTQVLADADLASLRDDPRFSKLTPSAKLYARPFVEKKVKIVHAWEGETAGDQFGWIARNIGDVDGDGVDDITTSAPSKAADGAAAGRVYVYSGKTGAQLWTRTGRPGEQLGLGIEAAGDTNADGIPDVAAGAPGADVAYVFSGKDGATLLTLRGEQTSATFGNEVTDVGDVNADGHDDVLVGAPGGISKGEKTGRVHVFSGKDGSILQTLGGERAGDRFGNSAAGYRDDEHRFLVVGAPDAGEGKRGRVYVYVNGKTEPRFVIDNDAEGAELGAMFVSVVGDVDADGVPDVYASDWPHAALGPSTGRIFVHSGRDGSRLLTLTGEQAGDGFGIGAADAGDVDGDGHDDLIVGAWQHGGGAVSGGKAYLFSGKDGELLRGFTSRVVGDTFGFDATGLGDVDGDGTLDLLVTSAWSAVRGFRSGRMLVISSGVKRR